MLTLTPEETKEARLLKLQGKSTEDISSYLSGKRIGAPSSLSIMRQEPIRPQSFERETGQDIMETFQGIKGAFGRSREGVTQAKFGEGYTPAQRVSGAVTSAALLPFDVAGEAVMGGLKVASPQGVEDVAGEALQSGVTKALDTDFAQGAMNWYDNLAPEAQITFGQLAKGSEVFTEGIGGGVLSKLLGKGRRSVPDRGAFEQTVTNATQEATQGNFAPATRVVHETLDPAARQKAVDDLSQSYMSSMVEDRTAINNRLDDLAAKTNRFSDEEVTRDTLIRQLADEGYIPEIEGRRARFETSIRDAQTRQSELMGDMQSVLDQSRETISTAEFYELMRKALREDPRIGTDINEALKRIDTLEAGATTKYGDDLTAKQVNDLKIEGNQKRGDVGKTTDPVVTDIWSAQARTGNEWLNTRISDDLFKRTNAEWGRLQTLQDTMTILRNQQIDVGLLGRALGSYVTTVGGTAIGLSVGGPGGLVVAGLLAKIGADNLADLIRKRMFNEDTTRIIREVMKKDDELRVKLKEEAKTMEGKNIIDDLSRLLPEGRTDVPESQNFVPVEAPQAGVRSAGSPIETVKEGAVKQSDTEAKPTELERAIKDDQDAVDQAVSEMEADFRR